MPLTLVLILVFLAMFSVVFPLHTLLASVVMGPFAFISAFLYVLQVSRKLTIVILRILFIRRIQCIMFTSVLKRNAPGFLFTAPTPGVWPSVRSQSCLRYRVLPFLTREAVYFVLSLVPVVGPILNICLKAPVKSYKTHKPYYRLMKWDYKQINQFYWLRRDEYTAFGVVAYLLEMVPGLTVLFMFTNNIGLALWTAETHARNVRDAEQRLARALDFHQAELDRHCSLSRGACGRN